MGVHVVPVGLEKADAEGEFEVDWILALRTSVLKLLIKVLSYIFSQKGSRCVSGAKAPKFGAKAM